jgi:predicted nucleic acid-binding protein
VIVYLDSSVFLAWVFGEPRKPAAEFWQQRLMSSRLLVYEAWNRIHARRSPPEVSAGMRQALDSVTLLDLNTKVLARALEPFPAPIRMLDALHLATASYLAGRYRALRLATYDRRMADAALALGLPLVPLE